MKIKIKQTFRSMWATILAVLMLLSTFSAVAVTLNKDEIGANVDINSTGWNTGAVTIYFDNTNTNWDTPYLIIGASGWATRYTMERVSGTQYLWKYTFTSSVDGYGAYYFTKHSTGFVGQNENINKIAYMGSGDATHQIAQQMNNNDLYTPASTTTSHSYTDGSTTKSVNTYDVTTSTYATYNVTSSVTGTGSGTITLKDYDNNTITSGSSVPYLTEITATVTPSDGELSSFTAGGTAISSGDKVTIKTNTSFDAVINKPNVTVYFYNGVKKYNASELCLYYWETTSNVYLSDKAFKGPKDNGGEKSATASGDYLTYSVPSSAKYVAFARKSGMAGYGELHDTTNTPAIFTKYTSNGDNNNFVPAKFDSSQTVFKPNSSTNNFNSTQYNNGEWSTYGATSPVATELSVSVTSSSPYYVNEPITLDKTATLTSGVDARNVTYSYEYSTDNSTWNTISDNANTYIPTTAGTYYFRVTASADGYTDYTSSNEAKVTVSLKDVATSLEVTATPSTCYVGDTITLDKTVTLTSGVDVENVTYSYEYSTDNSTWNTISDNANTYIPTTAGTYYFRVKASASGYKDVTSEAVSVAVSLKDVATSLEVTATPSTCYVGETITLDKTVTLTSGVSDPTYTYQVKKDSGSWEDVTGTTYTPESAGTYTFQVTASKTGYASVTSNNNVTVNVTVKPSVAESVTLTGASTAIQGDTVTYTADVTSITSGANLQYEFFVGGSSVQGPSALSTLAYTHSTTGDIVVKVVVSSTTGDYLPVEKTVTTNVTAPDEYYIEGRFKVRATENATGFKYVNKDNNGQWKNDSTEIKFGYSNGKYYLNTYCSPKELSDSIGGNIPFFRIAKKSGTTFTLYRPSSDTAITSIDSTVSFTSTNDKSAYFNMSSTEGKVVLYWDPTTKVLSYALTGLEKYTIDCDTDEHGTVEANVSEATKDTVIQLTVNPDAGYKLASLEVKKTDDDTVTVDYNSTTKTFTMPAYNVTVYATFSLKDYTMTGVANPNGIGGVVKCTNTLGEEIATANKGATVTFTATPVDGYNVSWNVTGVENNAVTINGNTATVIVGTDNVTATANYVGDSYNVTQKTSSNGTYTVTGVTAGKAQYGSTVIINPSPATGFALDSITVNKTGDTTTTVPVTNNSFTMPAYNVTITVKFKSNPGTATTKKFLYKVDSNDPSLMTALSGTVYENPTGTYTLTITDTSTISSIVSGNNSYFALSDTELYTGMHNGSAHDTETGTYVSSTGIQKFNKDGVDYYFLRASFSLKEQIKSIQLIFDSTNSKYIINAYDTSSDKKPLAESVTLEATHTTQVIGKKVTLKATLNNVNAKIPTDTQFTYTFYRGSEELGKAYGTNVAPIAPVTFDTTYNTASTQRYTVTVSTKVSSPVDHTPTDYESVTSNPVSVEYSDVVYYYAAVNPETGDVGTRAVIPPDNKVETTVSDGGTYYFSVFDNDTDTSPESVVDYTVDSANNRYCTISKSSTETGLDYLIVKCNAKCSNPVIYFNKANKTVYAVATQNVGSSKTLDIEKKVTYYFAEEKYDSTDQSDPAAGGDGMRIKYWNNSVNNSTYTGYADVTTKVIRPGTDNNNNPEENNSIFVWVDKFPYPDGTTFPSAWNQNNRREFYIYSVDLPIWATSFSFVKSNGTALTINNTSQIPDQGTTTTASIVLNPNRVYCFLSFNYNNYVRGVVLDDSLWDGNARNTANSNEVATQGFASNIVNYKTVRNDTSGNVAFNTALTAKYGTDYKHPLYFNGWYGDNDNTIVNDTRTLYGSSYFRLHDNLAMRKSYFASVQNLTDNRLSTTKKNKMGNGYLLGYNGALMPLFDYEMLNDNKTTLVNNGQLYENVQFPFYASTFNGVTTYSYDSTTDRNRLVETTEDGKTTVNVSSSFVKNGNSYGYFPFGGTSDTNKYGSGTEFDINFYMTNNGKLSNGDDIAFNFSGDDDVWVYVDGVRVLDLGGAHSVSSGTINFSDMKVYYKTAGNATEKITNCNDTWVTDPTYVKTVSLTDLFEANGATFSNTDASTQHTLQMFYLERGQGESNCSISFNLPQNTGFRVNSNVTTDSVNKALVEDTMASANKDYFNYQIANKLATATEYTNVSTKFANTPARAENVNGLTPSTTPSYPIKSLLISREFLGTSYYLTAPNATTQNSSDNGWLSSVNINNIGTFANLKNVNYTLSDAYAVKGTSDTESSPSGRVSETGIFNLLFGQSAIFESKIPNNTMIQLSQDDTISKVNAGNGDTTVITADGASTRTVSNYYSSSYSIVDDNTGLELANETQSVTDGKLYANDASANSNMFYFANYSGETNTSSNAMTVTYTNDVLTSKIKLAKSVQNPSATDNFYFKVEFSKIFGETLASSNKEYPDLQYKVYNSADDSPVATRTYGKAGVYFTANQYAIIEGVPVDSAYNVVEKDRAGYKFDSASKTTYNGKIVGTTKSYNKNTVDGKTVSGADGTTTYDSITFTNSKQAFTVNFKYYDRSVITGTTSHISTSPTTVTYSYATLDGYTEDNAGQTRFKLEELITNAYAYYKFDNVIDTYQIFTSQTAAENSDTGAGSLKVLRERIEGVTAGETSYSTAYPSADLGLHYDCYGRPQGTADCKATDGEDWVTYYNGSTKLSQTDAAAYGASVTSITVWLYNTPKKYMPTFYYADATNNGSDLAIVEGTTDRYVATTNRPFTIRDNVYYNVRLGHANGNTQNDAATDYLKEYGIDKGYCEEVPEISSTVTYNRNTLKFLYWASDPRGKNILSTDIAYGYRVTNNLKAYAVYGQTDLADKGLTITPNTPDYYSNSNGKALVRLNNVMNVYNCPERDTNIKNASIIYIIDYSKADGAGKTQMDKLIEAGGFDELQAKVREVLKANENSKNFLDSENIVIVDVTKVTFEKAEYGHIDITGFNHKVVPYNEALNPGTDDIKLTNKNRVQFTTSFTKSNLAKLKMYAMLGMDYGEVVSGKNSNDNSWIVSDNLLYYAFDANGNVSSIKDPILKHEFYNSTTAS